MGGLLQSGFPNAKNGVRTSCKATRNDDTDRIESLVPILPELVPLVPRLYGPSDAQSMGPKGKADFVKSRRIDLLFRRHTSLLP